MTTLPVDASTTWISIPSQHLVAPHGHERAMLGDSLAADPAPVDPMSPWRDWCAAFVIADGVALALRTAVLKSTIPVPEKFLPPLLAGLQGLNTALADVDGAFLKYIVDYTKALAADPTHTPAIPFQVSPAPITPWPSAEDASSKSDLNYFASGFDVLAGGLTMLSGKIESQLAGHPELEPLFGLVVTLVNSEQDILDSMKPILDGPAVPVAPLVPAATPST